PFDQLHRRGVITLLGGGAATLPPAARAQQGKKPGVGIFGGQSPETDEPVLVPFPHGLSEVGFVGGHNVAIESRSGAGRPDRLPDLADVLVSRRVAVIFTLGGTDAALAAKAATTTIPIVFTIGGDPVKSGLVASLNRPGGNVTGMSFYTGPLAAKRLELLHELVAKAAVIAVLVQQDSAIAEEQSTDLQQAARVFGLRLLVLTVHSDHDFDSAFATLIQQRADALFVSASALFTSQAD